MSKTAIQPLESMQFAQYAVPVSCYICEAQNTFDAEFCTHCSAPMALAHQANSQNIKPRMVAVVGASGVGKTVYLGMLMDMLSRRRSDLRLLARGAFSITLQQTTLAALARCEFPEKTPNDPDDWNWIHCQLKHGKKRRPPLELIMPDMAGEAVIEEVDHPHTYRVIRAFLKRCVGAIVMVDAEKLAKGKQEQDFFAMKLLAYMGELEEDSNSRKSCCGNKPVAIIFTKTDRCPECVADPKAFAKSHATGLWEQCRERYPQHQFFAVSVAGACAYREGRHGERQYVPLRIEPHGIVEPFVWLLEQQEKRGHH